MRKAYLKQYSNGYIKGKASKQKYNIRTEKSTAFDRFDEFRHETKNSRGEAVYKGGKTPRQELIEKVVDQRVLYQADRLQKLQLYNKTVLQRTEKSKITMFFSGDDVFLLEEFEDGTFRRSLQTRSVKHMKDLFSSERVIWQRRE